jgi:preprotein translocase subunit SecA
MITGRVSNFVTSLFTNQKTTKLINQIKYKGENFKLKTDQELEFEVEKVKLRLKNESLDSILTDWFALTQEVSSRTLGLRHFDTQLLAGILLHEGKIVEMKTGEGKTLAATLSVSLNALSKKGVHVVTVNEYLAERDQQLMGKLYKALGLTTGLVTDQQNSFQKQKAYQSDITYVTNSQVVFDFLRDSCSYSIENIVHRAFNYCVIDEIDSILIDEARTPLIISETIGKNDIPKLTETNKIAQFLKKDRDFEIDEKKRDLNLTTYGYSVVCQTLGQSTLFGSANSYILELLNALKANYVYKLNKDYIILNDKIVIVDESTGRVMPDRRWSNGLHEAIEIKEKLNVGEQTKTKTSITYQNFFTLYPKLSGMSGTAVTTAEEFQEIYNLKVVEVPTAKPMIRKDLSDFVYQSNTAKWKSVLSQIKECFQRGQPILIGTATVEKSELISELLKAEKIPHELLNAKPENVARESEIVALAGKRGGVTIATNMAGRGTDIILGGNPIFNVKNKIKDFFSSLNNETIDEGDSTLEEYGKKVYYDYTNEKSLEKLKQDIANLPYSLETGLSSLVEMYKYLYRLESSIWQKENEKVKEVGGLFVLGTERAETRRIDNQLRGRSGRQGDPGCSQFYVSLEDDLIKAFGGDNIKQMVNLLLEDEDSPLEGNLLSNSLLKAQEKVEQFYFETRKNVFEYDEILNDQRKKFFSIRQSFLSQINYKQDFLRISESFLDQFILSDSKEKQDENNKIKQLKKVYEFENWYGCYSHEGFSKIKLPNVALVNGLYDEIWISNDLRYGEGEIYDKNLFKLTKGTKVLEIMDAGWTEHLERMDYVRQTINWRSYGQQNPLIEYNVEAGNSYKRMCEQIQYCMIYYFLTDSVLK